MKSFLTIIMIFGMASTAVGQSTVNDVPSNPNTMPAVNGANSNASTGARNANPVAAATSGSEPAGPAAPAHKKARQTQRGVVSPKKNADSSTR